MKHKYSGLTLKVYSFVSFMPTVLLSSYLFSSASIVPTVLLSSASIVPTVLSLSYDIISSNYRATIKLLLLRGLALVLGRYIGDSVLRHYFS